MNQLDRFFKYHPPHGDQALRYEMIRDKAREFAALIMDLTTASPDQDEAIKHVRDAVFWANAGIACREHGEKTK